MNEHLKYECSLDALTIVLSWGNTILVKLVATMEIGFQIVSTFWKRELNSESVNLEKSCPSSEFGWPIAVVPLQSWRTLALSVISSGVIEIQSEPEFSNTKIAMVMLLLATCMQYNSLSFFERTGTDNSRANLKSEFGWAWNIIKADLP